MENRMESAKVINGYQVLRGFGCLGIMIAHSCHYVEVNFANIESGDLLFPGRGGMLNYVCFFFVLSGFLTARKIQGGGTVKCHILGRFWGIYPLYWLCLSIVILMRLGVYNCMDVSYDFWKSLLILPGNHTFPCNVEWTLQFEITFYMLVVPFFTKWLRKAYPFFVAAMLGFIISCKVGWITIGIPWLEYIIYGRDSLLWLFMGALMYYILQFLNRKGSPNRVNSKIRWGIAVVLIVGITFILDPKIYPVTTLGDYLWLIALLFTSLWIFGNLKASDTNILVLIGNHSYVIYLIHSTLFGVAFYLINKSGIDYNLAIHAIIVVIALVLLIGLSTILKGSVKGMRQALTERKRMISR